MAFPPIDPLNSGLSNFQRGQWASNVQMVEYRTQAFTNMLVERATWAPDAPMVRILETPIAGPDYVWFRFWVKDDGRIDGMAGSESPPDSAGGTLVEKYFDDTGRGIGMYVPLCQPQDMLTDQMTAVNLILALWIDRDSRVIVLNEAQFDAAVTAGDISAKDADWAEQRFRKLTAAIAQGQFPPALVRNFHLESAGDHRNS